MSVQKGFRDRREPQCKHAMAPKGVGKGPRLPTAAETGAAREKVERDRLEAVKAAKEQAEANNQAKRLHRRRTQSVVRQMLGLLSKEKRQRECRG